MLSRTRRIVAVAAPVATVAVVAALAFDAVERGRGAERLVAHTRDVMQNGDAVLARLVDAETGERGYVVTGGDEYLEPYERARADVDRSLGALRRLTADNPAQQRRLDTLDRIAHARFVRLDSVIAARRERGFEASRQVMLTGRGKSLMDSARVLLKEMQETESRLLARRNSAARWRTRVTVAVVLAGLLVTLGVALTVNRLLLRAAAREEEGARQLAERNALLAEQAAELEQQVEETQALAEELEQANDELLAKTAEAEEARRASEEANRAKAEFLATMSHELRTPLNAIGGYAELMALGIHGPVNAAQLRDLDRIRRGQRHLLGIITDILNFSRIDAGQMQLAVRDVPLPPLVDEVWSMIEPQASAKGIRYECEAVHDGGPLVAHADPDRVRQILANLLVNAVKFTAPGGGIRVECTASHPAARSPRATVRVTDTGVGIPPDNLERIFEPFVQLGRALTHTVDGTGLGLAISRDLARAMGGDVTVESEPGVGSAFSLTLPTAGR